MVEATCAARADHDEVGPDRVENRGAFYITYKDCSARRERRHWWSVSSSVAGPAVETSGEFFAGT